MKRFVLISAVIVACCHMPGLALAQWTGNANVLFGTRTLDDDDWKPLEEQTEFGVILDFRQTNWPVSLTVECSTANSDKSRFGILLENRTLEFDIGVKKIFENSSQFNPFIAGGLAMVNVRPSGDFWGLFDIEDDKTDFGGWISGGAFLTLSNHFNIGLQAKYTMVNTNWYGRDRELGGPHIGGFAGYHW